MDAAYDERVNGRQLWAAQAAIAELRAVVGVPGLAAARSCPGLLTEVDQHAAELRDALGAGPHPPDLVALAGYAEGLRDAAAEYGWWLHEPGQIEWARASWPLVRLLAVCMLAESARPGSADRG